MEREEVVGHEHIKRYLTGIADKGRVPHAMLFAGRGTLPMALGYARYVMCGDDDACKLRFSNLNHPDLHFAYPVATTDKIKSKPVSANFSAEWRSFVQESPYGDLYQWQNLIGIEKKQTQIGKDEAYQIIEKLSLSTYEGGYKFMLIWMAEKMNASCANKLLKLIEEPPGKTAFILMAENEERLPATIRSRCQLIKFPPLSEEIITNALMERENTDAATASSCARQSGGDYHAALKALKNTGAEQQFEAWFIQWVRTAFRARGNKKMAGELLKWGDDIAGENRETQKAFLTYCAGFFRQALLQHYGLPELVYQQPRDGSFSLEKFAPFVHGNNIEGITTALEEASYHIDRNGNAKIVLTDLSLQLTRLLHQA